jgi:carboxymethylenebutenolidase
MVPKSIRATLLRASGRNVAFVFLLCKQSRLVQPREALMGEIVEFASNGKTAQGYLALPRGNGPGIVLIQEWWGLNDHIKDVADRFAAEGYVVVAPDVYHGKEAKEPDEAAKLLMELDMENAGRDMVGAANFLRGHERVEPKKIGSVGFCMGGMLALMLGTLTDIDAAVGFYPAPCTQPDWSKSKAPALIHAGSEDTAPSPEMVDDIAGKIRAAGRSAEVHLYEDAHHAFFNDTRPHIYDPAHAKAAWERTLAFFEKNLR